MYTARLCPLARSVDRHSLTIRRTLVLPRLWETRRSQERPRAAAGESPLIKESRGQPHVRCSSPQSWRGVWSIAANDHSWQSSGDTRETGRSGGQRRLPVQKVGCLLSRSTQHNGSCLTDSKDDAVQREGGTVVVETQRMKKSRSTSTPAPHLRWIFRRGDRALTCQLERETDHSYAVSLCRSLGRHVCRDRNVRRGRRRVPTACCDCVRSTPRRLDAGGLRSGRVIAAHGRVWSSRGRSTTRSATI